MRQPQEVTIIWMPYPQNKPKEDGRYLAFYRRGRKSEVGFSFYSTEDKRFEQQHKHYSRERGVVSFEGYEWLPDKFIVAYAELPEGYKEDK